MIRIKNASFLKSAPSINETVANDVSEIAFIGRSNVGKSSIINALTNKKGLAKSSSTPGKTRLINFFDITFEKDEVDFRARFVDLPGFGYAKVSKSMKHEWQRNLTEFIKERSSIRTFIHLVDSRHPNLDIDKDVAEYLDEICRPDQSILVFFTKADKLKQKDVSALKKLYPDALMVSSTNKKGIQKAIDEIYDSLFGDKVISYTKAKLSDIALMQDLVVDEVKKGTILFRSSDEMATNIRSYVLAKDDEKIIGFGALHFHAFDLAEVRSLMVSDKYQGQGIGKGIVKEMLKEGKDLGVKKIFTLTYVKGFFESLGFNEISKESLPAHKIWADCIKCKHFPVCDEVALIKVI